MNQLTNEFQLYLYFETKYQLVWFNKLGSIHEVIIIMLIKKEINQKLKYLIKSLQKLCLFPKFHFPGLFTNMIANTIKTFIAPT
jgi:hypothetical protein